MIKRSGPILNEIKLIYNGILRNRISRNEAIKSALIGALATGTVGSLIGAVSRKKKRVKGAIVGGAIGAGLGLLGGPAYAQLRKYLDGVPFDNSGFLKSVRKKGGKVYIGVAGSANGEDSSWFAREMRRRFGDSVYMLRHVDGDKIESVYKKLKDQGLNVEVVGHSSGGATAAKFLDRHRDVNGYVIDPVSWFGRTVPPNAVVFTADKSVRHGGPFENTIADLGGRWNYEGENSVIFKGSHSDRMGDIIRDYVSRGVRPGEASKRRPDYVTGEFGNSSKAMPKQGSALDEVWMLNDLNRTPAVKGGVLEDIVPTRFTLDDVAANYKGKTSDQNYFNILVGGANAAGKGFYGLSALPFGVLSTGKNRAIYRHNQEEDITKAIEDALKKGLNPRVFGHSWGGSTVARIAKRFPGVQFYSFDPVSWTGRLDEVPENLTIYRPKDGSAATDNVFSRLAPIIGGRWPMINKGKGKELEYAGGHVSGLDSVADEIDRSGRPKIEGKGHGGPGFNFNKYTDWWKFVNNNGVARN